MYSSSQLSNSRDFRGLTLVLVSIGGLVVGYISKDTMLFLLGDVVFLGILYLFFVRTLPPVLLMNAFFQWFFFHGKLIDGLFKGEFVMNLNYFSKTKEDIIVLGFLGTAAFFVGVYITARKVPIVSFHDIKKFANRIDIRRLLRSYVIIYSLLFIVGNFIWLFPGLSQPLFILTLFRWSLFFLLFISIYFQKKYKGALMLIIFVDIIASFFSFFSHFKEVIYFSFLAYWIFYFRGSFFSRVSTVVVLLITFYLGIYWTAIKEDYRKFLNKGTGMQAVLTSRSESYLKLFELVGNVEAKDLDKGYDNLIERLSWIGAFDAVYKRVPSKIPHEEGKLWWTAVTRPFKPRILFPDKKGLSDSKELNYYSNLNVEEKNTSISLSMMAGSYIDFGSPGMHGVLFLFGLFCGWVYAKAVKWGKYPVVGYALTMPMIYMMQINENSINRMVSTVLLYFLVLWFVQRFLLTEFMAIIIPDLAETRPAKPKVLISETR